MNKNFPFLFHSAFLFSITKQTSQHTHTQLDRMEVWPNRAKDIFAQIRNKKIINKNFKSKIFSLSLSSNQIDKRCDKTRTNVLLSQLDSCLYSFFFLKRNANISSLMFFFSCSNINLKFERFGFLFWFSSNCLFIHDSILFALTENVWKKKSEKTSVSLIVVCFLIELQTASHRMDAHEPNGHWI